MSGRLAMVGAMGLCVQAALTHEGPWKNFTDHVEDPLFQNVLRYFPPQ